MQDQSICACGCGGAPKPGRRFIQYHHMQTRPMEDRFWPKVDRSGDCWLWLGSRNQAGYGRIGRPGRGLPAEYAHRYSWQLANGPIPAGMEICHTCDTPPCVRPDHLFLGTHRDNARDMTAKGRNVGTRFMPPHRGEQNGQAILTAVAVNEVRRLARESGLTRVVLAATYGVRPTTIADILRRRTWTHLP